MSRFIKDEVWLGSEELMQRTRDNSGAWDSMRDAVRDQVKSPVELSGSKLVVCSECLKPCPEHNITYCSTCHNHNDECEYGGCHKKDRSIRVEIKRENGEIGEIRYFCNEHGTSPVYAFARK